MVTTKFLLSLSEQINLPLNSNWIAWKGSALVRNVQNLIFCFLTKLLEYGEKLKPNAIGNIYFGVEWMRDNDLVLAMVLLFSQNNPSA